MSKPTPGKLTDLDINEISLVDMPANNRRFLIKKGITKEMEDLKNAGLDPEQVVKNLENATPEQKEGFGKEFVSLVKKFFEPKKEEVLTKEDVQAIVSDTITKALADLKPSKADTPQLSEKEELEKKLAEADKIIEAEQNKDNEIESLKKALAEKEATIASIKKAKAGGNAVNSQGKEEVTKSIWADHPAFR